MTKISQITLRKTLEHSSGITLALSIICIIKKTPPIITFNERDLQMIVSSVYLHFKQCHHFFTIEVQRNPCEFRLQVALNTHFYTAFLLSALYDISERG